MFGSSSTGAAKEVVESGLSTLGRFYDYVEYYNGKHFDLDSEHL